MTFEKKHKPELGKFFGMFIGIILILGSCFSVFQNVAPYLRTITKATQNLPAYKVIKRSDYNIPAFVPMNDIEAYLKMPEGSDLQKQYLRSICPDRTKSYHPAECCQRCAPGQIFKIEPYQESVVLYSTETKAKRVNESRDEIIKQSLEYRYEGMTAREILKEKLRHSKEVFSDETNNDINGALKEKYNKTDLRDIINKKSYK